MKNTHEHNRMKMCILCFHKVKSAKLINNPLKKIIKECFLPDYDEQNEIYPKVLCGGCYRAVYRCKKGDKFPKITVHEYLNRKITREATKHVDCDICHVAQQTLQIKVARKPQRKGRSFAKTCNECLTLVGPGKAHKCNANTKLQNLSVLAGNSQDHMVAKAIREKSTNEKTMVSFSNLRGKPTRIKVMTAKGKENTKPISHEEIFNMKTDLDLSTRKVGYTLNQTRMLSTFLCPLNNLFSQTLKLARNMRLRTRKAIQPGLKLALQNRLSELEDFFGVASFDVSYTKGKSCLVEKRPIVMCDSVEGLVRYVKARRNVEECILKVGIDGGQGSIKIVLCIEDKQRQQSKQGFKDSGVRQALILALAPGIQENYENISKFWNHLSLTSIKCFVAGKCL